MVQRIVGRLVLVVGLVLASALITGGVASAGGPTSVLLSAPSADRVTALRYSHPSYNRLDVLLHNGTPVPEQFEDGPNLVTATWLIHDVQIWRIDRIYLDAPGGPLVGTQQIGLDQALPQGLTPAETSGPTLSWRRINDGAQVRAMLAEVGILGATPPASLPPAPVPAGSAAIQPAATPTSTPSSADGTSGWWWGAAGLFGGAGATLLLTRRRHSTAVAEDDEAALVVQDGR